MNHRTRLAVRIAASRHRIWIICGCALVATAAGVAVAISQPTCYTATAQVGFSRVGIPTQATVAQTPRVAARRTGVIAIVGAGTTDAPAMDDLRARLGRRPVGSLGAVLVRPPQTAARGRALRWPRTAPARS